MSQTVTTLNYRTLVFQTPDEHAAGVVPLNISYYPYDARRYGWGMTVPGVVNTAAQNTAALALAVKALNGSSGTILLPQGTYPAASGIAIPQFVIVRGAGKRATILNWDYSGGNLFTLGGTGGGVAHGTGLTDLGVQPNASPGTSGTVVLIQGTAGAEVSRLYLEGPITASRSTNGVVVDGSNASAYFNRVSDVWANHFHTGFTQLTTGAQEPTNQLFSNIQCNGDVATDTTSTGLLVGSGGPTGQISVYNMFNFEECGTGVHFSSTAGSSILIGGRFEANTLDVLYDNGGKAQTWLGGLITTITDNSSPSPHQYFGVTEGSGTPIANRYNQHPVVVSDLPASVNTGSRQFVSNATATTFGTIVVGGGTNPVPVYFDGTNWRIG